jgi:hemerythrin-like domain-containing protein
MSNAAPALLNDDGTASMATALMMSHHGFRRDLMLFARALQRVAAGDETRVAALREEWKGLCEKLHGHHNAEDTGIFPHMKAEQPQLSAVIDGLAADHRRIDPILEAGERAFAQLPDASAASAVVAELTALLDPHLATEEAQLIPFLRAAKQFPPPANETELGFFAQGFAWASHGIADEVLQRLDEMLPPALTERLPAARAAYEARCEAVWGTAKAGAARTPIPDRTAGALA